MSDESKLITDFMKGTERNTYDPFTIEGITYAGEWVMFSEKDKAGYYTESHMIPLLEIVLWAYANPINTIEES
jgi:hypothetical protein